MKRDIMFFIALTALAICIVSYDERIGTLEDRLAHTRKELTELKEKKASWQEWDLTPKEATHADS